MGRRPLAATCLVLGALALAIAIGNRPPVAAAPPLPRPAFAGMLAYFGELHQHTGYSPDGCGLPVEVVTNARSRGNDFVALIHCRSWPLCIARSRR